MSTSSAPIGEPAILRILLMSFVIMITLAILAASKMSISLASRKPISFNENASIAKVFVIQSANVGGNCASIQIFMLLISQNQCVLQQILNKPEYLLVLNQESLLKFH